MLDLSCFLGRLITPSLVHEINEYTRSRFRGDPVRVYVHQEFDSISVYPRDMYSGLRMADADIGQSRAAVEVFTMVTEVGDTSIHRLQLQISSLSLPTVVTSVRYSLSRKLRNQMGYTTEFNGSFRLDKPLTPEQTKYLKMFASTRRVQRNAELASAQPDPFRAAIGMLPIGIEGEYFVNGDGYDFFEPEGKSSVINYNRPPATQPGLWCQWIPNDMGTEISWDEGEKFYEYVAWIAYIIEHFIRPWGYTLEGSVTWSGEDSGDIGRIVIENNEITVQAGKVVYE